LKVAANMANDDRIQHLVRFYSILDVLEKNVGGARNPLGLYPAYRLYENRVYGRLVEAFGVENIYILSAGWGLIRADFLTPYYDITFSHSAEGYLMYRP
jgi:hypothetical protein